MLKYLDLCDILCFISLFLENPLILIFSNNQKNSTKLEHLLITTFIPENIQHRLLSFQCSCIASYHYYFHTFMIPQNKHKPFIYTVPKSYLDSRFVLNIILRFKISFSLFFLCYENYEQTLGCRYTHQYVVNFLTLFNLDTIIKKI